MTTALTIRYIAFGLYFVSFVYMLILTALHFINRFRTTGDSTSSFGNANISEKMSIINEWSESADAYEEIPGHSRRVAELSRQIGERYGLSSEDLESLECAALLHDIGQVNNFNFIKEPRELDLGERIELEEHPIIGEEQSKQIVGIGSAPLWIRMHHEKWDGTGYPDQLIGEMIPLPVRILTLADSYDSLTHDRPHSPAMSPEEAITTMQSLAGIKFDPNVVQVFTSIESEPDVGSSFEV